MSIALCAVRVERTPSNAGKPMREEQTHNGHHTVCSTGGTFPK